jgi:hypothetical protein
MTMSKPASLVVQLSLKSADLACLTLNQPLAFSSFPGHKGLNKRKHDATVVYDSPDAAHEPNALASQRPRLEMAPATFALPNASTPYSRRLFVPIDSTPNTGPQNARAIVNPLSHDKGLAHSNAQGLHGLRPSPDLLLSKLQPQLLPYFPPGKSSVHVYERYLTAIDAAKACSRGLSNVTLDLFDDLHSIARSLVKFQCINVDDKPDPTSHPEVWATTRLELCETLHYFRAYKSASQTNKKLVKGFMFADNAHPRDFTDASVVVSRAGGGMEYDPNTGKMKMKGNQRETPTLEVLRKNMTQLNPVVIITAKGNPCMPSKVPHEFCVLDHFKPTNIWTEKTGGKTLWRFRFEKLNSKKPSWWQPKDTSEAFPPGSLPPPIVQTCANCHVESQQIYLQGWMCLKHDCSSFWKLHLDSGLLVEPKEDTLLYDPRFLKQRTPWGNEDHNYPLTSDTAQLSSHAIAGEDCSRAHWSGLVCPNCGRCVPRLSWEGWECSTTGCNFFKEAPHTLIPATSIREPFDPLVSCYMPSRDAPPTRGVLQYIDFTCNYRIQRYTIPGIEGFVTHFIANKTIVEEPSGPDDMFEELQRVDIGLRRRPLSQGFYTRHFAVNYGMPYKFIAATSSASFDGAARPIGDSRSRLNWAAKLALAQYRGKESIDDAINEEWKEKEFNEVLALGYLEEQRINYHDDGETGLGPTIATLSLGAPGIMKIRMKAKHFAGVSSTGILTDAPPIPGCDQYAARLAKQSSLEALKATDKNGAYKVAAKKVAQDLGLSNPNGKKAGSDVLDMLVGHGDIVIMHGADLQKYYEHSVSHTGKLRFALTCRYIDPGSLKAAEQPDYEVKPDTGGYDGSKLPLPA